MATIIKSNELGKYSLIGDEQNWVYNGMDCMLTYEIFEHLEPQLNENTRRIYDFERAMLGPALQIMRRGMCIDHDKRVKLIETESFNGEKAMPGIRDRMDSMEALLNRYAQEIWGKDINIRSPVQLLKFFYTDPKGLNIPPIYIYDKGEKKMSTKAEALEKMIANNMRGEACARVVLRYRELKKKLEVLETNLDPDGRMHCTMNVSGTETGRWSSRASPFGTGTNMQNISPELREIFVPDPGYTMFYADLEQAESRAVAYLSGDEAYIEACESGDLHTTVCQMVWQDLPWTDNLEEDKEIAKQPYYRHFSYRDLAKRAGHGTNYVLTARSLANHLKIEQKYGIRFQLLYYGGIQSETNLMRWGFTDILERYPATKNPRDGKMYVEVPGAFPGIRTWHDDIAFELESTGKLTTPLGRERQFWGRLNDPATLREAVAFKPQSLVGDILNIGLYRVWNELEPEVQVLGQVHDAVVGQTKTIDKHRQLVLDCLTNPIDVDGRTLVIPVEFAHSDKNWKDCK